MTEHYPVVIIGGGPAGVALGLELGYRGIECTILERETAMHRIPKGQNLTGRTSEHFYFWDVLPEIRAARAMPPGYPIGGVTVYGNLMGEYWAKAFSGDMGLEDYYYQNGERLPQYDMEDVMRAKLASVPGVDLQLGVTATDITQDGDGVKVTVEQGGATRVIECDYAVGCDGGRSTIRDLLNIKRVGTDFDELMVLAVFRSNELHEALEKYPHGSVYSALHPDLEGAWRFFGRIDVGEGWFFHTPVPADTTQDNFDFEGLIQEAAGFKCKIEFDDVLFWNLRIAVAETYQDGRIFIAGDAAHSHPPYGGLGINNGFEDVVNLGWKLAAKTLGWGGAALLDSYSEERRPIFRDTGEDFIAGRIKADREWLKKNSPEKDGPEAFQKAWEIRAKGSAPRRATYEPNYEGSSVIMGPPGGKISAHGTHTIEARAGHHLPPRTLSAGGNVYEAMPIGAALGGTGFTLIALDAPGGAVEAFEAAAGKLNIPLAVIKDSFDGGREEYDRRLILVRPDQYVVWVGDDAPEDADGIMSRVVGRG